MSCTKNVIVVAGIFSFKGPHNMKAIRMGRFMRTSKDYIVLTECTLCGIQEKRSFVNEEELMKMGVTLEEIKKNRDVIF